MTHLRIGLTGKMRSGKDTAAEYLTENHGFHEPLAFGDALKYYAHQIFPDVPKEPKPRELYQFMNVMREFDLDVWVKHLAKQVEYNEELGEGRGIVVTDARQPNEVEWLRNNGFVIVKVEANEHDRHMRMINAGEFASEIELRHPTELYVDDIVADYTIPNFGTVDDLYARVDEMVTRLRKGAE